MKYSYLENENKLLVYFDKGAEKQMLAIMELLDKEINYSRQPKYFMVMEGVEVNIDAFLESCISNNYRLYDNGKYNMLIKNLPTLCLLSADWSDVVVFYEFIGSFNEGQMNLTFLESQVSFSLVYEEDKSNMIKKVRKHCIIEICVYSDGYLFEINSGNPKCKFTNLTNWLSVQNAIRIPHIDD